MPKKKSKAEEAFDRWVKKELRRLEDINYHSEAEYLDSSVVPRVRKLVEELKGELMSSVEKKHE